jgi:NitT/TauT family transport system permease protein
MASTKKQERPLKGANGNWLPKQEEEQEMAETSDVTAAAGRTYKTKEDVGFVKRFVARNISWSTVRIPSSIVLTVLIWHVLTTYKILIFQQVPTPLEVLKEALHYIPAKKYWQHVLATNVRVFSGFLGACILGIPLGLAMGYKRIFNEYTFPIFEILRPCPPIAWLPISVIMFPTIEMSVVFLVFIGAFFPVVMNTYLGVITIPVNYRFAALSLGAPPRDIFRKVILPGATPSIFTGMAVGMGMTWEMVVAAEMVAGGFGLGYMTWEAYMFIQYPRIILGMVSLGVCGYVYSGAVRTLGDKIMPWRRLF